MVVFTSDNGPWLTYYDLAGTLGPWRDGKITTWEGGFRVPGIFWWPQTIQPSVVSGIGVNIDLIKTISTITNTNLPEYRYFDAIDLTPTLLSDEPSPC